MEKLTPQDIDIFFSEITEGIAKFDPEGCYIYVNNAYAEMLGYKPEELIGQYWESAIAPFERERLRALYQEVLVKGRVCFRTQALKKSGELFHKESIGLARYDGNNNFIGTYCLSRDVTTEVALAASQIEYKSLYQLAPVMIHTVDSQGRIVNVSNEWLKNFGYERLEVLGKYSAEFLTEESQEKIRQSIKDFSENKSSFGTWSLRAIKKSGDIFDIEMVRSAERDSAGNLCRLHSFSRDLSIEKELERMMGRYESMFNHKPIMMHCINSQGYLVQVSDMWLHTLGYEREEVLGRKSVEFLTEPSREKAKHVLKEFMETGYLEGVSYQMVKKNGEIIDVILSATCERDEEGNFIRSIAFIRDITEFNKEEKMIRLFYEHGAQDSLSLEERLDRILKAGLEHLGLEFGLISHVQGEDYTVLYSHSTVPEMSIEPGTVFNLHETYCEKSYQSEDVLSYYNEQDKGLSKLPCYQKFHLKCYIGCPVYREGRLFGTVSFSRRDDCVNPFSEREKAFVRFMAQWVGGELSRHAFIEQLQESEAKLSHVVDALRKSNEELENFAYVCSHDLQEPLRMVSAFSSKLMSHMDANEDPQVQKFLDFILKGARNAQSLVSDLLAYAQITHNVSQKKQEEVCIPDVIASILEGQREIICEKGVRIHVGDLANVLGNRTQFLQLFQNLITNALKFSPEEGGQVFIGFEKGCFFVKDNGIGIEKKYHEKVFEIFHRLNKNSYSGTGIGLATCKKIVEGKGGKIWIESEPGKGATFFISFPKQDIKQKEETYAYAT